MIEIVRRGRGRAARGGLSPKSSTALRGAAGALMLASAGAAQAQNECGLPEDGIVVCTPDGNPYPTGITYSTAEDLLLRIESGVATSRGVRNDGAGGASVAIELEAGSIVINSGLFAQGVSGFADAGGDVRIDSAGEIWTNGFLAAGIRALAREDGSITIRAAHVDSTGGNGISVGGANGPVFVETYGHVRATDGDGLFGDGLSSVAGIFVNTDGAVEVVNSGLIEQIGPGSFDPNGSYITMGGISIRAFGDIVIAGDGIVETSGWGATGIAVNGGGTASLRHASVTTHGEAAQAVGAAAPGDVSIDIDQVTSDLSIGISGFSRDGHVRIRFDSVSAESLGAYGETATGSVWVEAGDVTTTASRTGLIGSAIQIQAAADAEVALGGAIVAEQGLGISIQNGGDARVTVAATGSIDADYSGVGIVAGGAARIANQGWIAGVPLGVAASGSSVELVNDGEIFSRDGGGVLLDAPGAVAISGTGSVAGGGGDMAHALRAGGGTVTIAQSEVAAYGDEAMAVLTAASGNVAIDIGRVYSELGQGLRAESTGGNVTVNVGALDAVGFGIEAIAAGLASVTVGDALALGPEGRAILAEGGEARVTVTGAVDAPDGFGVAIFSRGDGRLEVGAGGSIRSALGAAYMSVGPDSATVVNAGTIGGGGGYALMVEGGAAQIANSGRLVGGVFLDAGDDVLDNDGVFDAGVDSDFGGGDDRFDNAGRVEAAVGGAGAAELAGLERLANAGTVTLADGAADDVLTLGGDYAGEDGELLLDVLAGEADLLVVEGAATGTTRVQAQGITGLLDAGTLIVRAGAGSSADAFTIEALNIGFVEYGIRYDAGTGYSLVGAPGDAAIRTVRYVEGARNVWQDSSDAWSAQMRGMRDSGATGSGFWIQARGSVSSRDGARADTVSGITVVTDTGYRQDHFGAQLGYDFGREGDGIGFGLTAGYGSSDLGFGGTRSRLDFSAVNAGAYAAFASGPFFANLLAKYDHLSGEARDDAIALAVDADGSAFGATAEAGARIGGGRLFAEPVASLSWVRADLDGFSALASEVDLRATDGLLGRVGARFGSSWTSESGAHFAVHAGGNAVKALGERDEVAFSNNGQTILISNDRPGWFGEAMLGLSIAAPGGVTGWFEGFGTFGGDDTPRGAGGRAGIRVAF